MLKNICLLLIVFMVSSKSSYAQAIQADTNARQRPNSAIALFYSKIGKQSPLYNGKEFTLYSPKIIGTAFFLEVSEFKPGNIFYDGLLFADVPMMYDLNTDDVIILSYNTFSRITLIKDRVNYFDFLNHHIVNVKSDSISASTVIKPGYYDMIYHGKSSVLVKRAKSIQQNAKAETYFNATTDFYVKKDNIYYSFGSQSALLKILNDKKKQLKDYINTNKIKYRADREDAMIKIVSYYDHLTN